MSPRTRSRISREKVWKWELMGCAVFGGGQHPTTALAKYPAIWTPVTPYPLRDWVASGDEACRLPAWFQGDTHRLNLVWSAASVTFGTMLLETPSEDHRHRLCVLQCSTRSSLTGRPDETSPVATGHSAVIMRKQTCRPVKDPSDIPRLNAFKATPSRRPIFM